MDTIARSDAFFFVTTICIVIVTLVVVVLGAYLTTVVADLRYIVKKARASTDEIADDIRDAREALKDKGRTIGALLSGFFAFRSRRKRKKRESSEE